MKTSTKTITLAAAITAGLGAAFAIAPSYAQDAEAADNVTEAETVAQIGQHHGVAGFAFRAGPGPDIGGPDRSFRAMAERLMQFDTNEDGTITQDEIDAARAAELAEFDADGDGTLSLEEYQELWLARVYEQVVDAFQHLDADGDGIVTEEEFNAMLANVVDRLDQNGDGALSDDDRAERESEMRRDGGGAMQFQGPNGRGVIVIPGFGPGR